MGHAISRASCGSQRSTESIQWSRSAAARRRAIGILHREYCCFTTVDGQGNCVCTVQTGGWCSVVQLYCTSSVHQAGLIQRNPDRADNCGPSRSRDEPRVCRSHPVSAYDNTQTLVYATRCKISEHKLCNAHVVSVRVIHPPRGNLWISMRCLAETVVPGRVIFRW